MPWNSQNARSCTSLHSWLIHVKAFATRSGILTVSVRCFCCSLLSLFVCFSVYLVFIRPKECESSLSDLQSKPLLNMEGTRYLDPSGDMRPRRNVFVCVPFDLSTQTEIRIALTYIKIHVSDFAENLQFSSCLQHIWVQKLIYVWFTIKNIVFLGVFCFWKVKIQKSVPNFTSIPEFANVTGVKVNY